MITFTPAQSVFYVGDTVTVTTADGGFIPGNAVELSLWDGVETFSDTIAITTVAADGATFSNVTIPALPRTAAGEFRIFVITDPVTLGQDTSSSFKVLAPIEHASPRRNLCALPRGVTMPMLPPTTNGWIG